MKKLKNSLVNTILQINSGISVFDMCPLTFALPYKEKS